MAATGMEQVGARGRERGTTDAELVARSCDDPHAFTEIFDRHFAAVHRYLHRRAGRDVADELAAETFRIAFEQRGRWSRRTPNARPWLLGIATNLLRRHRRTEARRLRALARGGRDEWAVWDESTLASRLDARGERAPLAAALAALSRADRDAVSLVALAELSYAEAAFALGISPRALASRLSRARRQLTQSLTRPEEKSDG